MSLIGWGIALHQWEIVIYVNMAFLGLGAVKSSEASASPPATIMPSSFRVTEVNESLPE